MAGSHSSAKHEVACRPTCHWPLMSRPSCPCFTNSAKLSRARPKSDPIWPKLAQTRRELAQIRQTLAELDQPRPKSPRCQPNLTAGRVFDQCCPEFCQIPAIGQTWSDLAQFGRTWASVRFDVDETRPIWATCGAASTKLGRCCPKLGGIRYTGPYRPNLAESRHVDARLAPKWPESASICRILAAGATSQQLLACCLATAGQLRSWPGSSRVTFRGD